MLGLKGGTAREKLQKNAKELFLLRQKKISSSRFTK